MARSLLALALAGAVVAQTPTVQLLVPMGYPYDLEGSVVDVSPSLTTFVINCAHGANDDCDIGLYSYVTQGPSSWVSEVSTSDAEYGEASQSVGCTLAWDEDTAICSADIVIDGSSTATVDTLTDLRSFVVPVTITAGGDQLDLPEVTASTTSDVSSATEEASSTSEEVSSTTTTVIVVSSTETSLADESTTTESPSTTSTGAPSSTGSEEESTETDEPGAAGRMTSQSAALVGVVALIGGVLMM